MIDKNGLSFKIRANSYAMEKYDHDEIYSRAEVDPEGRYQQLYFLPNSHQSLSKRRDPEGRYQSVDPQDDNWPKDPFLRHRYPDWRGSCDHSRSPALFTKGARWIKVDASGNIVARGVNGNYRGDKL